MAASAVARVLTFIAVIIGSYFKWSSDDQLPPPSTSRGLFTPDNHLAGLILARGGSKGIPHKNMRQLNGQPLIYWALKTMIESGVFTTIWVSTDDTITSEWVSKTFPSVRLHPRASFTATDDAASIIAVQEFISFHPEIDAIGLVQATSPFVQPIHLQQAKALLSRYESVFSVYRSRALRWKSVGSGDALLKSATQPLNFDPKNRPRRQDWDGEMVENGMFYFSVRDLISHENVFQGARSGYVEVPKLLSMEIDTLDDLELAEFLMPKKNYMENKALYDDNVDVTYKDGKKQQKRAEL